MSVSFVILNVLFVRNGMIPAAKDAMFLIILTIIHSAWRINVLLTNGTIHMYAKLALQIV
jgi:hypothetical protein